MVAPASSSDAAAAADAADSSRSNTLRSISLRKVAVWGHRYIGLFMTVFLVVAGLTGSLLAFYHELDELLSPGLYQVQPPAAGVRPLDPFELREALQRQLPPGLQARRVS